MARRIEGLDVDPSKLHGIYLTCSLCGRALTDVLPPELLLVAVGYAECYECARKRGRSTSAEPASDDDEAFGSDLTFCCAGTMLVMR